MDLGLEDKVVVIVGAGSGIGLSIAHAFAGEGSTLVLADLDPAAAQNVSVERKTVLIADVTKPADPVRIIDTAIADYGRIDVLVNVVGVAPFRSSFLDVTDENWTAVLDVNFMGVVRSCRAAIPYMREAGTGSIVTIASDIASQPDPFFVDYAVSKAALVNLSKSLSIEFGPKGIRANCVAPGPTLTPAMLPFLKSLGDGLGLTVEEAKNHFVTDIRKMPLGQMNDPNDVAQVVLFLSSERARQVTGSTYAVDAGVIIHT